MHLWSRSIIISTLKLLHSVKSIVTQKINRAPHLIRNPPFQCLVCEIVQDFKTDLSLSNDLLYGSSRTNRGIPVLSLWRHQSFCHLCKVCDHSTKGSCTSLQTTGRVIIDLIGCYCCTGVLYLYHLLFFRSMRRPPCNLGNRFNTAAASSTLTLLYSHMTLY